MGRRLGSVSISSFVRLYMLSISFLLGVSLFMSRVQLRFYGVPYCNDPFLMLLTTIGNTT